MNSKLELKSILNPHHRKTALMVLQNGDVIVARFLTLYGLFADISQEAAADKLLRIKGKPRGTPIATLLPPTLLSKIADLESMAEPFKTIFKKPALLERYYRIPHFLQIPVKSQSGLPDSIITTDQNEGSSSIISIWFSGYRPIDQFLHSAYEQGMIMGATSLNVRHLPTIVNDADAINFCLASGDVSFILADEYAKRNILPKWSGSFSILSTIKPGSGTAQNVLRSGNIEERTLAQIYGCKTSTPKQLILEANPLKIAKSNILSIINAKQAYLGLVNAVKSNVS